MASKTDRRKISGGSKFEELVGYSRVVVDGDLVLVSGTAGFDYGTGSISEDVAEQAEQTFRNIEAYLAKAGCTLADVVRALIIITDRADWERVVPVLGRHFRPVRPATTAMVAGLVDPRMKIEIEVTARLSGGPKTG